MQERNTTAVHAWERVNERLADAGFDPSTIRKVHTAAKLLAQRSTEASEAIRLMVLRQSVNEAWGDRSNGNEVWAIVRAGELRTVMLRRSTQPHTPQAFNVTKVTMF